MVPKITADMTRLYQGLRAHTQLEKQAAAAAPGDREKLLLDKVAAANHLFEFIKRDTGPKEPGGGVIAWPQGIGDDLAGASAQRQPQPDHSTPAMTHKSPQFIQFQDIIRLSSGQGRLQRWHPQGFFFSQAVTVFRDTPKVRLSPRRLLRSW